MTTHQQRMIALAEQAEAYIKQESRKQSQSDTHTNLENRQSKRKRIQQAKRQYARD